MADPKLTTDEPPDGSEACEICGAAGDVWLKGKLYCAECALDHQLGDRGAAARNRKRNPGR